MHVLLNMDVCGSYNIVYMCGKRRIECITMQHREKKIQKHIAYSKYVLYITRIYKCMCAYGL